MKLFGFFFIHIFLTKAHAKITHNYKLTIKMKTTKNIKAINISYINKSYKPIIVCKYYIVIYILFCRFLYLSALSSFLIRVHSLVFNIDICNALWDELSIKIR